jgi:hypothetical protein
MPFFDCDTLKVVYLNILVHGAGMEIPKPRIIFWRNVILIEVPEA